MVMEIGQAGLSLILAGPLDQHILRHGRQPQRRRRSCGCAKLLWPRFLVHVRCAKPISSCHGRRSNTRFWAEFLQYGVARRAWRI